MADVNVYSRMVEAPTSTSKRAGVTRPTRGADRNRDLVSRADPTTEDLLLPALGSGVTLLEIDNRGVAILQSLVLDHLLLHDGPVFWVDANGHATPTTLSRIAPGQRLLDRIHVARGFTAYQHYGAVDSLPEAVDQSIPQRTRTGTSPHQQSAHENGEAPHSPSLIVAPAVDARYRGMRRNCFELSRVYSRRLGGTGRTSVANSLGRGTRISKRSVPVAMASDHRIVRPVAGGRLLDGPSLGSIIHTWRR